ISFPFLAFFSILPITGIAVSIGSEHSCPLLPFLPKYLIIHGLWFLFMLSVKAVNYFKEHPSFFVRIM
ncbi:hypothetical protein PENTCL1PPCAC_29971, partial [Pristionchus entomophagus]